MKTSPFTLTKPGWIMAAAVTVLLLVGLASIYVTDTHYVAGHDGPRNAERQCAYIAISLSFAIFILHIGYQALTAYSKSMFVLGLLLLLPLAVAPMLHTTFGGLTPPRNGAYRWIQLPGLQLQPSEFVKLFYVFALAAYLKYRRDYRQFRGLLVPFGLSVLPLVLILVEPDLGTVLLLIPVLFAMLFVAGARISHLAIFVLLGLAAVPVAWGGIRGYQRARVTAVLLQSESLRQAVIQDPARFSLLATKRQAIEWAASSGYQLVHSKNAIGSGGLWGNGWGEGVYATQSILPDRHNDFIFAVIGHQFGFAGCCTVLVCYLAIVAAGVRIAVNTDEPAGRLLATGLVTLLASQAVVNVGMATGLVPTTGMTLPFVSHGGSSLLSSFAALALLVSVSQHRPFLLEAKPFEFTRGDLPRSHPAEHPRRTAPGASVQNVGVR